ncbi:DNA replication and repair protein RecN [Winogradskyella wandonensis]|uniref:DNA repair protein RecN n=1 Tax=Winogradskyella wandonensis TaxID=1442586 RepID=A0A4R1KJU4_9FLAO|nr:DNA repair protein RecN [Winogradskyella wandonensis]TCK64707.1 DNA replication and repair protein RecN [Winogradskyella wandonensis]
MLTSLSISNFALIDALDINFNNGFSIITGETGAGKSILLGGLSLVLGKRADLSQIKDNSKKCVIEAVFDIANYDLKSVFVENDLDYDPQTIIRREILPSGKSRAFVNDTPVTLDSLNALSAHLLDIHSQHQTLQLVDDDFQFKVIDALARNKEVLKDYKLELKNYRTLIQELSQLEANLIEAKKEYDYNAFLLNELNDAQLKDGELEELEASYEQLNNVEVINEVIGYSKSLLEDEDVGAIERLNEIKRQFSNISNFSKQYASIKERIESVAIELDDVLLELDNLEGQLSADPEELDKVNGKLLVINNLLQKHSVAEVSELIKIKEELTEKVSASENLDADISSIKSKIETSKAYLDKLATEVSVKRETAIPKLISSLEGILKQLGMPNARFNIQLDKVEDFKYNGKNNLHFLFTANKGGQFLELKKSASGGELSRIMLAIKSILANYVKLPTIMFDEIDTGVSGEISDKMGDIMKQMSKHMQVFSITHLPQIASKGDWHYKVFKTDVDDVTQTNMKLLTQDDRIVELAQMLGGANITESAIAHAKQLLN